MATFLSIKEGLDSEWSTKSLQTSSIPKISKQVLTVFHEGKECTGHGASALKNWDQCLGSVYKGSHSTPSQEISDQEYILPLYLRLAVQERPE